MTPIRHCRFALIAALPLAWIPRATGEPATLPAHAPAALRSAAPAATMRFDAAAADLDAHIEQLIAEMTLAEKIGQMCQTPADGDQISPQLRTKLRAGDIGSLINVPSAAFADEAQRLAAEESRLGIPLLVGRDVIHGHRTIFPIPLGQAASWNPELIESAAKVAAGEARAQAINWTFAPMVDVCRDPRWGRIAETLGEDPLLASALAAAMVRGFQQERDGRIHGLVACAKHFVGYGLAEGGRDYNRVSVSPTDLHNIHLLPFRAAAEGGCRTMMTTFSEVNGVPGTAHRRLIHGVLRGQWQFPGFVVSDWNSVIEMVDHGYSADAAEAAGHAVNAGVDMEMASTTYHDHLAMLLDKGAVAREAIDNAVRRVLRVKLQLPATATAENGDALRRPAPRPQSLAVARRLARESLVLLKNDGVLPLDVNSLRRLAIIGGLADDRASQLGCWALDGDPGEAISPREALEEALSESADVRYAKGASGDFSTDRRGLEDAEKAAAWADAVVLVVGESALLSGESRSRAELRLPGVQSELVQAVARSGKPVVMVVLAGRPLTLGAECDAANAVLYAWHPGTMGGPALADVLLGVASPSGKLPVTFPKSVGQAPLYYGHTNTGRPSPQGYRSLAETGAADLPIEFQYRSHYLDDDARPLFPFGYGLSYGEFGYSHLQLDATAIKPGEPVGVQVQVKNTGRRAGSETVQLYLRDLVARPTRPVRELKAFRKVYLRPGEQQTVEFTLRWQDLASLNSRGESVLEPGRFALWVGGDSSAELTQEFEVLSPDDDRAVSPAIARTDVEHDSAAKEAPAVSNAQ